MQIINNPAKETWLEVLKRPTQTVGDIEATVTAIFKDVAANGDKAVAAYTKKFDGIALTEALVSEPQK
jgi:histidinol dehydrogenase